MVVLGGGGWVGGGGGAGACRKLATHTRSVAPYSLMTLANIGGDIYRFILLTAADLVSIRYKGLDL